MTQAVIRVLLVEDDEDDYVLTRDLLAQIPGGLYTLEWVSTFDAGLAVVGSGRHDVYLIDYQLGEESGLDLLRALLRVGCRAPIILLTGQGDASLDSAAMQAGAADYLIKGEISAPALKRALRHACDREHILALRDNALAEAEHERDLLQILMDTAPDSIYFKDAQARFVRVNWAQAHLLGASTPEEVEGKTDFDYFPPAVAQEWYADDRHVLTSGKSLINRLEDQSGSAHGTRWMLSTKAPIVRDGLVAGLVGISRDITDLRAAEESLRHQALHDSLTDLPNRSLLHARIAAALGDGPEEPQPLALLLLDLDHFKEINDAFGHHRGDALLREAADRLRVVVRSRDTVARLGGGEFAVLLPGANEEGATRVAETIRATLDVPHSIDGQLLRVGTSIGIALAPTHGADGATLLRRADMAMYAAKRGQLGQALYEPTQDQHNPERLARIAELREAIERGTLALHYQPQVDLVSGCVCGAEALVRWAHPVHGPIAPDQFIPLAEQTGLIAPLTDWVLAEAIRQCREWQRVGIVLGVSVNLSMWNLHDPALPERIAGLLRGNGLSPAWLRLELTETALMADTERTLDVLARLSALGLRLAVDDFGAGYSGLAYLKKLPVDELKIDKGFVREMATDATDTAIVASTVALGHALGLRVVAEGVEDQATWDLLAGMGCDEAQGYHIARPLPPDTLAHWLCEAPWAVA
ncbi:MAG: hypothetical protein JWO42_1440 [Chloroflexi bacterium]|jgi:diguanylate cyclase (GGDEF)-like protein/PAS domain S-box-containing protein|nr:hypothetical protein [Chloroflexota bacterium]